MAMFGAPVLDRVDIHTHILPPELPRWSERFGYGGFIRLQPDGPCRAKMLRDDGTFFRDIAHNCWDGNARLADMARDRVALQVLSTVPTMFCYWTKPADGLQVCQFLNDHIAEVCHRDPGRFAGLGSLPLQDPQLAIGELRRCKLELGLCGVQIGSHVRGPGFDWNLSDPRLFEVFAEAERLGAAIFVHPWDMMGEAEMARYWLPWLVGMPAESSRALCSLIFGGVISRLPGLRICVAHGGGAFAGTIGRIQHGFQARPDLCAVDNPIAPMDHLGRFWVDSLVHDPRALRLIMDVFGSDKVALGTDYPFPLGEAEPGRLIDGLDLQAPLRRALLVDNGLAWLGLSADAVAWHRHEGKPLPEQ